MLAETIFNAGRSIFDGMGNSVLEAQSSETAIKLAGLDWTVESREVQTTDGIIIPNTYANVRTSDNSVLGVVADRYRIVQNSEAFAFTDSLLGEGVKYETAGALARGKRVWLLARMDSVDVLGDEVIPYLLFSNSFDGKGSIKVALTPIRVICQNTLTLALKNAVRTWSVRHSGDIQGKLAEASQTLELANGYTEQLAETADKLTQVSVSDTEALEVFNLIIPHKEDQTERQKRTDEDKRSLLWSIYKQKDDIQRFKGTAYGVINAVADFEPHVQEFRRTATARENRMMGIADKSPMMEIASKYFAA